MLKRILIIALSILILIGAGGCMKNEAEGYSKTQKQAVNKKKSYTNEEKKNMVLKYLKDKYDEEFEGISYKPAELLQGHDEFYMYSKSRTKEDVFQVWGSVQKDGTYKMRDGYFGIIIHDEYQKVMKDFVSKTYNEYKLYTQTATRGNLPQRLNKNTKVSDVYMKSEVIGFSSNTYVYVNQSSAEKVDINESIKKIAEKMAENKLVGSINIYVIPNDKFNLIKMDKANWQNTVNSENSIKHARLDVNSKLEVKNYEEGIK